MDEVKCIRCGEAGDIRVDVQGGDDLTCGSCDETYTAADVREVIGAWEQVLGWLDAHPAKTAPVATAAKG